MLLSRLSRCVLNTVVVGCSRCKHAVVVATDCASRPLSPIGRSWSWCRKGGCSTHCRWVEATARPGGGHCVGSGCPGGSAPSCRRPWGPWAATGLPRGLAPPTRLLAAGANAGLARSCNAYLGDMVSASHGEPNSCACGGPLMLRLLRRAGLEACPHAGASSPQVYRVPGRQILCHATALWGSTAGTEPCRRLKTPWPSVSRWRWQLGWRLIPIALAPGGDANGKLWVGLAKCWGTQGLQGPAGGMQSGECSHDDLHHVCAPRGRELPGGAVCSPSSTLPPRLFSVMYTCETASSNRTPSTPTP